MEAFWRGPGEPARNAGGFLELVFGGSGEVLEGWWAPQGDFVKKLRVAVRPFGASLGANCIKKTCRIQP